MKPCGSLLCSLALSLAPAIAFAQGPSPSPTNFCPSGTQPDGYIIGRRCQSRPASTTEAPQCLLRLLCPCKVCPALRSA